MTTERTRAQNGRQIGSIAVVSLGVALAAVELKHLGEMDTVNGIVLEAALPLVLACFLTYGGVWLGRSDLTRVETVRLVGWIALGVGAMAGVTAWVIGHQLIRGETFHHVGFVVTNTMVVGAVGGFIVGVSEVRSGRRRAGLVAERRKLSRERERMLFLNRLLRHNVLNEMNVVLGRAMSLRAHVDDAGGDDLRAITRSSEDVVALVKKARTLSYAASASGDDTLEPVDLSAVLAAEIESLRLTYPEVTVATSIPEGVRVAADDLLSEIFQNLLRNAVVHHDGDDCHVTVAVSRDRDAGTATATVADDGPGIPDVAKADLFRATEIDPANTGHGVGLTIVRLLVTRYGGDVSVADNDPRGATFVVQLPLAAAKTEPDADRSPADESAQRAGARGGSTTA